MISVRQISRKRVKWIICGWIIIVETEKPKVQRTVLLSKIIKFHCSSSSIVIYKYNPGLDVYFNTYESQMVLIM